MKLSAIQVKFETSKYQALKRYAVKKEVSLEQELEETLNRLYRKLVPPDVREYIEESDEIEKTGKPKVKKEEKEPEKEQNQTEQPQDKYFSNDDQQGRSNGIAIKKLLKIYISKHSFPNYVYFTDMVLEKIILTVLD